MKSVLQSVKLWYRGTGCSTRNETQSEPDYYGFISSFFRRLTYTNAKKVLKAKLVPDANYDLQKLPDARIVVQKRKHLVPQITPVHDNYNF